jgi:hypothetical protein
MQNIIIVASVKNVSYGYDNYNDDTFFSHTIDRLDRIQISIIGIIIIEEMDGKIKMMSPIDVTGGNN